MSSFKGDRAARKPYTRPAPRAAGDANGQWLHDKAPKGPRADLNGNARAKPTPTAPSNGSNPATTNTRLLVSNLHYEITPKDLSSIFGQIGVLVREPLIRYDRSGRSSGTAIVAFETPVEATRAKKQFDGILAKGQPMAIAYDNSPPRQPRRAISAPSSTLIQRIQKPNLVDRLSRDDIQIKAPSGPRRGGGVGPVRTRPTRGINPRERASRPGPKKPKTAEELDKELDAFMGDSEETPAATAESSAVVEGLVQDVDMV